MILVTFTLFGAAFSYIALWGRKGRKKGVDGR
jgi:hypothetical protein